MSVPAESRMRKRRQLIFSSSLLSHAPSPCRWILILIDPSLSLLANDGFLEDGKGLPPCRRPSSNWLPLPSRPVAGSFPLSVSIVWHHAVPAVLSWGSACRATMRRRWDHGPLAVNISSNPRAKQRCHRPPAHHLQAGSLAIALTLDHRDPGSGNTASEPLPRSGHAPVTLWLVVRLASARSQGEIGAQGYGWRSGISGGPILAIPARHPSHGTLYMR